MKGAEEMDGGWGVRGEDKRAVRVGLGEVEIGRGGRIHYCIVTVTITCNHN